MTAYSEKCPGRVTESPVGAYETLIQLIRNWVKNQRLKAAIQRERRELSELSDAHLQDIGISRATAQQEAQRRDVPAAREFR